MALRRLTDVQAHRPRAVPEPAIAPDERWYVSALEAARVLGLSKHAIYDMLDRGELEGRRFGRTRQVALASLLKLKPEGA